jgi:hypothetical protein
MKSASRMAIRRNPELASLLLVLFAQAGCSHLPPSGSDRKTDVPRAVGIISAGFLPEARKIEGATAGLASLRIQEAVADGAAAAEEEFERGYDEIAARIVSGISCE